MIIGGTDIETTGLDQEKGHRIIEFAAALYDFQPESGLVTPKGKFVQRINPQRAIDPAAQAVHGISFEDVSMCPDWAAVAPKVVKVMSACDVIVAHNGNGFDMPFIAAELMRIGLPVPNVRCVDTMLESRWATPMGKLPNLGEFCFACGVDYDPSKAHAAEYDVLVMMEGFFKAVKKGFIALPVVAERKAA